MRINKTIYKYSLKVGDVQAVQMHRDADILSVQLQNGQVVMWALCDPLLERELCTFEIFGTGHTIEYGSHIEREFIGTFQQDGFVGHLFKRIK